MIETILEMLTHVFMQRAILVGILVCLCAALLGISLVLKRFSMIGDGLSHVGYALITIAAAFGISSPLYIAVPGVIIAAILLLKIGNNKRIKNDSAIAIISSSALAIGAMVTSLTTGLNTDVCNFMFGSVLAMSESDIVLSVIVAVAVVVIYIVCYKKIFIITFDEDFAVASGLNVKKYTSILAVLTAVIIVVGMRMLGTLLISSIIIFPALTSMRVFKTFKKVVISSSIVSVFCFLLGLYLSYILSISTGAMIVVTNLVMFIIFYMVEKIRNA